MTTDDQPPLILEAAGDIPGDLIAVAAATAATLACVYVPVLNESLLRILFGVAMVLFIPGYALIASSGSPSRSGSRSPSSPSSGLR